MNLHLAFRRSLLILIAALAQVAEGATSIDFETTPVGVIPTDNTQLQTTYSVAGGGSVRFFFDTTGNNNFDADLDHFPAFEQIGANAPDGFNNSNLGQKDVAAPGFEAQLGNFFLINSTSPGTNPEPFVALYSGSSPISGISGEI